MKFCRPALLTLAGLTFMAGLGFGFRGTSPSHFPGHEGPLTDLTLDPSRPSRILAASKGAIYAKENETWNRLFTLPPQVTIRHLVTSPLLPDKIFLVSETGLLEASLKTKKLKWLIQERSQNRIHSFALHPFYPQLMYLGTDEGLWMSRDAGRTWSKSFRWPENESIELVAFLKTDPPILLLGARGEFFVSRDEGESYESGFSVGSLREVDEEVEEKIETIPPFVSFANSFNRPPQLWIGTREGVFESQDGGTIWRKLPDEGWGKEEVRDLIYSDRSGLFAATQYGVSRFHAEKNRWETIPLGWTDPPTAMVLKQSEKGGEILLVLAGKEILEWIPEPIEAPNQAPFLPSPDRLELARELQDLEPSIQEVQKAAIRYARLGNGKIDRWHWGSRMRALIPRLTFGRSFSLGNNVDIDRGSTNDPDRFIFGPEDFDRKWDLGLAWELGDLLYSSAQTSIDSRAKLLVELRESILNQITRVYFERRRIQMQLILSPAANLDERLELFLQLQELTAQIDALTDGFLSNRLEEVNLNHPELKGLFQFDE